MSIFDTNTLLLLHCDDFNDTCDNYIITNNGVTISSGGKFGNCFNVNQSYITFNKSIELNCNTGFTIDFWINPSRFDNQYQYHLSSGLNFVSYDKNKVYCSMCGINKDAFYVNEPLVLNEFTHIAIVGENNVVKIFINGVLKASKNAINETQTFNINNKFFMYQSGSTSHNPVCKIDEFRISNVARWQTDFEVPTKEYELVTIEKLNNESSLIDINDRNELLAEELCDLKTRLKNNLNNKDVSALDSDSLSVLIGKVGTISTGKKWASGTSIASNWKNFKYQQTTSSVGTAYIVIPLEFTPTVIVASCNYGSYEYISTYRKFEGVWNNNSVKFMEHSSTSRSTIGYNAYLVNGTDIVNNTYHLPTYPNNNNLTYSWIAFE